MTHYLTKTITVLGFLIIPALVAGQRNAQDADIEIQMHSFEEAPCPFEATPEQLGQIRCGWVSVPEYREKPNGRTLRLAVAIVSSLSENPEPDPLVYIPGGPGTAGFHVAASFLDSDFRNERELIFYDPRGVGRSEPSVCPDLTTEWWNVSYFSGLNPEAIRGRKLALVEECRREIDEQTIDLSQYNTKANAHDLYLLRKALGYEHINLWGRSYGSRVALESMRMFPGHIRSVILDGPSPHQATKWTPDPENFLDVLNRRLLNCETNPQCKSLLPDAGETFWNTFHQLQQDPWMIETDAGETIYINGTAFASAVYEALTRVQTSTMVPLMIQRFAGRDKRFISHMLRRQAGNPEGRSWWVHLSVNCFEKPANTNPESNVRSEPEIEILEEIGFGRDDHICDTLHPYRAKPAYLEPVASSIPVLILAGEYDPATHRSYGVKAAETLSRSQLAEIPGAGHDSGFLFPCTRNLFEQFLEDPDLELNMSCLESMARPEYVTDPTGVFGSGN